MYLWKRKRNCFVSNLRKLQRKFFHTYKMHFYLLITTWYTLTFRLSIQFVKHTFHLWFLLIFYDDVYRWQIPPPCLVSRQIILKAKQNLSRFGSFSCKWMFMHILIKYTVRFGYIANYLIKIDNIDLRFPKKNIICSKHLTYPIAVLSFIVQW